MNDKLLLLIEKLTGNVERAMTIEDFEKAAYALALKEKYPEEEARKLSKQVTEFGAISPLMEDPDVEDIMINDLDKVFVYNAKKGMLKSGLGFKSLEELDLLIKKLVLLGGKKKLSELTDLHLPGGSRANIVASPFGPQVTIRRFKQRPPSIIDLVEWGTLDYGLAALLWLYTEGLGAKPANMLIAGPPASGKTTLLNALFSFYPEGQRTVVVEDTFELNTGTEDNCSRLITSEDADMEALVKNSLRMRPDRILVGEVRGEEAKDLMTAMNIGKVCSGTIHAGTAREAVMRLENEPMKVPIRMIPLIDAIIVLGRFTQDGRSVRRVVDVSETAGIESSKVLLSQLYDFDFQDKALRRVTPSVTYRDRLSAVSGVSSKEVMDELDIRARILRQLQKRGVKTIPELSRFCRNYYEDPKKALSSLKGAVPKK